MSEINEINIMIIPETPKMISNEQIFVYIPERLIPDKIRWGTIIGDLSDQDDLKNALLDIDTKVVTNTSKIETLTVDVNNNKAAIEILQTSMSNKLDKSTTKNALYGTYVADEQGTVKQKMFSYHELPQANAIVQRDLNGDIIVRQSPLNINAAVSKKYVDDMQSALELSAPKEIILGAEGVGEDDVYNFTVENVDTYLPYKTNGTKFLLDLNLPLAGSLTLDNKVVITFGDTVYYLYNILKGLEHVTIRDLKQVDKYNNTTGYRFIFHATFFQNDDITGFAIIPTISMSDILSLTSDEMDTYMMDGGLTEGQIAICNSVGTAGGYTEGHLYKFEITYPSTYSWKELTQGGSGGNYTAGNGINITDNTISADTDVLATKEDLANDIPVGNVDIIINGTQTETNEDLVNIIVDNKTYKVPANTTVETLVAQLNAMKLDLNAVKLGKQNVLKSGDITTDLIEDHAVTDEKLATATMNTINNSLQIPLSAPTETELVGIGTNKSQLNIGIGSGLSLKNGILEATGGSASSYMPNLLLNDEMIINQRGKSVYYGENAYGTDRWMCVDESAFMRLNSNSQWIIGLEDTESAGERTIIKQIVEDYKSLKGQIVTLTLSYSSLTESVSGTTQLAIYDGVKTETIALTSSGMAILTTAISSNADRVEVRVKTSTTGTDTSLVFKYCKLELGSSSTVFIPKNTGLSLIECQRYYQKLITSGCSNTPTSETTFEMPIDLLTSLRTTPVVTLSAKPTINGNGSSISSVSYDIYSRSYNNIVIKLLTTQSMTLNQVYVSSTVTAELDAEMY